MGNYIYIYIYIYMYETSFMYRKEVLYIWKQVLYIRNKYYINDNKFYIYGISILLSALARHKACICSLASGRQLEKVLCKNNEIRTVHMLCHKL